MKKRIRHILSYLLLACVVGSQVLGNQAEILAAKQEKLNKYVITLTDENAYDKLEEQYSKYIVDGYERYRDDDNLSIYMGLTEKQAEEISQNSSVAAVEDDIEFHASGNAKRNKKKKSKNPDAVNWNLRMVGAASGKGASASDTIKVAVMDSGIDYMDYANVKGHINLVDEEKYIPEYFEDVTGHGTAVTGIIADIHKNAEIYSVRVLDSDNKATLDRIVEGIYWCIANDIQIINMSFGAKVDSSALREAVEDASDAGILMVASTGNGAAGVEYPAAYDKVIAVGAVDSEANVTEESNFGEEVELVAPGEQVDTAGLFGGNIIVGGTSMSAAHVTGAASLIWSVDSGKSAEFAAVCWIRAQKM